MAIAEEQPKEISVPYKTKYHWEKEDGRQVYFCAPHHVRWTIHLKRNSVVGDLMVVVYRASELVYAHHFKSFDDAPEEYSKGVQFAEDGIDNEVCHSDMGDFVIIG